MQEKHNSKFKEIILIHRKQHHRTEVLFICVYELYIHVLQNLSVMDLHMMSNLKSGERVLRLNNHFHQQFSFN